MNGLFRYEPHAKQRKWIDTYAREKLFGGAKRGGKSAALAMHITLLSMAFPGNRGLLARKAFTDLKDSTLAEFKQIVNPDIYEIVEGGRRIVFKTDPMSECLCRGLGEEGEFEKAKSVTVGFLALDEPSEIPKAAFLQLNAQLTHVLPNGQRPPYMTLLGCNPEPGWVKDRYVTSIDPAHLYVQALPRDNPGLPPNWEAELRAGNDEDWVKRYLDGSWDVFEGQVFKSLRQEIHNLDNWTANWSDADYSLWITGLRKVACIDHATTGITTYGQDGIDRDDFMYSFDEYYQDNRLISEHAEAMKDLMRSYGGRDKQVRIDRSGAGAEITATTVELNDSLLIDPSTEAKTQQGQHELYSFLDVYRRNGILAVPAVRSAIEVGIDQLKQKLKVKPDRIHPFTGQPGSPDWFISKSRCPNLWREMTELRKVLLPAGGVQYVGSDHAIDTKRYVIMSRPKAAWRAAEPLKPEQLNNTLPQFARNLDARFARQFDKKIRPSRSYF